MPHTPDHVDDFLNPDPDEPGISEFERIRRFFLRSSGGLPSALKGMLQPLLTAGKGQGTAEAVSGVESLLGRSLPALGSLPASVGGVAGASMLLSQSGSQPIRDTDEVIERRLAGLEEPDPLFAFVMSLLPNEGQNLPGFLGEEATRIQNVPQTSFGFQDTIQDAIMPNVPTSRQLFDIEAAQPRPTAEPEKEKTPFVSSHRAAANEARAEASRRRFQAPLPSPPPPPPPRRHPDHASSAVRPRRTLPRRRFRPGNIPI